MRKSLLILLSAVFSIVFLGFNLQKQEAQESVSFNFATGNTFRESNFKDRNPQTKSSNIKDIQAFGEKSVIAYTNDTLFRTEDNGESWREIQLPKDFSEKIGAVYFEDAATGSAILGDNQNLRLALIQTRDGGNNWIKTQIELRNEDSSEADLENASLKILSGGELLVSVRIPTSSNFSGNIFYQSSNNRQNWNFKERTVELRRNDEASGVRLTTNGF